MSLTLAEIAQQEEALQLNHFNHDVAWQLGCALKQMAESQQVAVAIEVYGFGQTLFQYAMPGTCADHLDWMRRKRNSVLRYGRSSYYLSLYNAQKQREFETQPHIDAAEYCAHGGSFPIRIAGSGLVGAVTVSGLAQLEDHQMVSNALQSLLPMQAQ
ncbi:heme-degrading domain-containing protein [Vibrio fluvialis]|uniref:heme-degrading domain-containing protein n=1 Tax=Vibrio fluvialis TaxID=676 RepID=UPI001C9BEC4E|nr:heme-degrading domain-containing protein [Vibrio fluvialis]EKO3376184.1 heme-degrading domain-containing protein [Vibrio fluvialis]MBY8178820.1 heme-degrading domain-containing protein [Vibrio fluvialis]MCE7603504.1 heme-degrading domain-containing protein [Vibrio fluvialis]WMN57617.1 heme-degrading domain-containing protein [Vibrio fluvialis]